MILKLLLYVSALQVLGNIDIAQAQAQGWFDALWRQTL